MWFLIPVAAVLGKLAYDYITDNESTDSSSSSSASAEQQKRKEYQQKQKEERAAEMQKKLCAYATSGATTIMDRHVSFSLKSVNVNIDKVIAFAEAETDTPEQAMNALSSLLGSKMKLNLKREKRQIDALEGELKEIAKMVAMLEREKDNIDDAR